jgi:hypothetical protein
MFQKIILMDSIENIAFRFTMCDGVAQFAPWANVVDASVIGPEMRVI